MMDNDHLMQKGWILNEITTFMGIYILSFPLYNLQVTIGFSFEQNFTPKKNWLLRIDMLVCGKTI